MTVDDYMLSDMFAILALLFFVVVVSFIMEWGNDEKDDYEDY